MCTKGYVYVDVSQNAICQRKKNLQQRNYSTKEYFCSMEYYTVS